MRVLFLGEIVGKAGHFALKTTLNKLVAEKEVDCIVANANGATGGFGLGKVHSITLSKKGINVLTGGECILYKKDMVDFLPKASWVLRPANLPYGVPGRGWRVYDTPKGPLGVICLLGQSGYTRIHAENPFKILEHIVKRIQESTRTILLNFHAITSAEKRTMAFFADSMVSAMIGTGSRCLSADAMILDGGTAVITDAGRTGSRGSVYGMETETELRILTRRIPERSRDGWGDLRLQGVLMTFNEEGKSTQMETIDWPCGEEAVDPYSKDH